MTYFVAAIESRHIDCQKCLRLFSVIVEKVHHFTEISRIARISFKMWKLVLKSCRFIRTS